MAPRGATVGMEMHMDKKTAGLVGVISALPLAAAAPAAAKTLDEVMTPRSYAELLQPIPNAPALLKEAIASQPGQEPEARVETAQYYDPYGGDGYYQRPRYHHHHHHHNSYGGGWGGGGYYGGGYYARPRYHHHHHHHHDYYWNPY
jgi:hypothetical protein